MTDCLPDETGIRCRWCGWEWKRGGKFPRRNCPSAPGAKEAARQRITAEMKALAAEDRLPRPLSDVLVTLESCFGGCEHLENNVCQLRGSACKKRRRWLEFIACRPCQFERDNRR